MNYKINIDEEAFDDIKKSAEWYENQSRGLGTRFKNQVIKQIDFLKINPLLFAIKYNKVRCSKIKNFPFLIHYTVDEIVSVINVFAVLHTSRNPKIWNQRLK